MKTEKQHAIAAWKNAIDGERVFLTPLLKAIGKAIATSPCKSGTFRYAHELGKFSRQIADTDLVNGHLGGVAALDYQHWKGKWHVRNHDLQVYSTFAMWMSRSAPENKGGYECEISRISTALKRKRMQQAYDRFKKTGLRKEHLKLLAKALWEVDTSRGDWVSLFVEGKRPFGDSSRAWQMYQILGWPLPKVDRSLTDREEERAWDLFDELPFALPILVKRVMSRRMV